MSNWMEAGLPNLDKLESLPWVAEMKACPQDAIWHAEGDVWTHTKMVMEAAINLPEYKDLSAKDQFILCWSAIFHDIGKPPTTKVNEEGRTVAHGHTKVGEKMARQVLWNMDLELREQICAIVRLHGKPVWWMSSDQPHRQAILYSQRLPNHLLYLFAKADMIGRVCKEENDFLERIELYKELCKEADCWVQPYQFASEHSKFRYFIKGEHWPVELYDDTEFKVVILSGIAGSGKDHFAQSFDLPMISLDEIRKELNVGFRDKKAQGRVAQLAYDRAKTFGAKKQSFIWNSTNLTSDLRMRLLRSLSVYNPRFELYYMETSQQKVQAHRGAEIPRKRLEAMYRILEMPLGYEAHGVEWKRWN